MFTQESHRATPDGFFSTKNPRPLFGAKNPCGVHSRKITIFAENSKAMKVKTTYTLAEMIQFQRNLVARYDRTRPRDERTTQMMHDILHVLEAEQAEQTGQIAHLS